MMPSVLIQSVSSEETTDTVEDKLLHLMGTVALTDEISSATDEAEAV